MSLLDDLKKQAEEVKEKQRQELSQTQARARLVEDCLRPRMRALYDFFRELKEQLDVLDPDVRRDYQVEGVGVLDNLRQGHYRIEVEDPRQVDSFAFRYTCARDERLEFRREQRSAQRTKELLWSHNLRFATRDASGGGTTFLLSYQVPVSLSFGIDPEKAAITLRIRNLERLGLTLHRFAPERIDQEFMDELGKCVLREPNRFNEIAGNVIPESTRARLREQLERQKAAMQRAAAAGEGGEQKKRRGLLGERFGRTLLGRD